MEDKSVEEGGKLGVRRRVRGVCSKKMLVRRLPVIRFLQGYTTSALVSDMMAGVTVGLTFIPSSMASALVAGLPPHYGLYSSFMCYFVYAVLGSSRSVIIGPTVITAMLCKPFVDKFGPEIAITLCCLSGCIISTLGILNLGFLVDFISSPVLEGFLSSAASIAISGQVAYMLGIPGGGSDFISYWVNIVRNIQDGLGYWDLLLGLLCMASLVALQYLRRYAVIPEGKEISSRERRLKTALKYVVLGRTAIVVVISTGIIAAITGDGEPPVQVADEIEPGLPEFTAPPFEIIYNNSTLSFTEGLSELSTGLITIPLIIIIESIASAKAFADGKTIDATQEMIAVGMSNLLGSFVQSIPVAASVTRTTINHSAGAQTPLGGIVSGSVVLMALGLLSPALKYMPKATLAAVIILAVYPVIQIHKMTPKLWRSKRSELLPLYVTFVLCLAISLDIGMIIGILFNTTLVLHAAARPTLALQQLQVSGREVLMVRVDRGVSYPAAEHVKHVITKRSLLAGPGLTVVLDGQHVSYVDTTAVKVLQSLMKEAVLRQQCLIFWNWSDQLVKIFVGFNKIDTACFVRQESLEELITSTRT